MNGDTSPEQEYTQFIEVDPTRRYGRYDEILGKGASKTVYRAFDEYEGIEVAWNQVKLYDFLHNPEDIERLYREIHLLKTLNHKNIMKLYSSWADTANRNMNFVTEMFTSGTLRQYRLKHKRVNIRAVKHWCRQILSGLLYLHSHDLPVIHRDLKCDNIFINGNTGEVKIGDLGLAAILRKSHAVRCVGTPEFMAPEVYEEEYNELVDIYSFGMCVLEMVTYEYPYSECNHPAQIYEKVTSGKKPEALYNVKDPEVRQFVEKCLATVSLRLPARELLRDPFLHFDDSCYDLIPREYQRYLDEVSPLIRQPYYGAYYSNNSSINTYTNYLGYENGDHLDYHSIEHETSEIGLFNCQQDENFEDVDIAIKGKRKDDDDIFLRLRIADKEGRIRNIYFPFDIETDTAMSVAKEMVAELDIMDQDVTKIADMIDAEIVTLVPEWKKGSSTEENQHSPSLNSCHKCGANVSLLDYVTPYNPGSKNLQVLQCSKHECATIHGRFQEITYQLEGSEQCLTEGAPNPPNQSNGMHYADICAPKDGPDLSSQSSKSIYCDEAQHQLDLPKFGREEKTIAMDNHSDSSTRNSSLVNSSPSAHFDDYENDIRQEVRWLKAKFQMQLSELRGQQIRVKQKQSNLTPNSHLQDKEANGSSVSTSLLQVNKENRKPPQKSPSSAKYSKLRFQVDEEKKSANLSNQNVQNLETVDGSCSPEKIFTAKSFYAGNLLPNPLHRADSLPVDAIDV